MGRKSPLRYGRGVAKIGMGGWSGRGPGGILVELSFFHVRNGIRSQL